MSFSDLLSGKIAEEAKTLAENIKTLVNNNKTLLMDTYKKNNGLATSAEEEAASKEPSGAIVNTQNPNPELPENTDVNSDYVINCNQNGVAYKPNYYEEYLKEIGMDRDDNENVHGVKFCDMPYDIAKDEDAKNSFGSTAGDLCWLLKNRRYDKIKTGYDSVPIYKMLLANQLLKNKKGSDGTGISKLNIDNLTVGDAAQ